MARKTPPVPVPDGCHYCFVCETVQAVSAFYLRHGKPTSPCRVCAKKAPERAAAMLKVMEDAIAEVRAIRDARPPSPPPVFPVFAVNDGLVRWVAKQAAEERRKAKRLNKDSKKS